LAPDRLLWLETSVWQHVQDADCRFVAHGRLRVAPGKRQRLELTVRMGKTEGQLVLVSDGRQIRQTMRVGIGEPTVTELSVSREQLPGQRDAFDPVAGDLRLAGVCQVLAGIRQHLLRAKVRRASWRGQPVYTIQGEWKVDPTREGDLLLGMSMPILPRHCTVFLDSRTLWPCRLEWTAENDRQTWQLEFREPQINQPLSPAQCSGLFTLPATAN
jgi:hypothetical protein